MLSRSSGVLLPITCLPSCFGIGDLGPAAFRFVDFLNAAGQRVWQVLPLNPVGSVHHGSPYSGSSAFAMNPLLISPELLGLGETFTILTMATIGGLGTFFGPVIGAILLTFFSEALRFAEEMINLDIRMVVYGAMLMVTILFMRGGIVGLIKGRAQPKPEGTTR